MLQSPDRGCLGRAGIECSDLTDSDSALCQGFCLQCCSHQHTSKAQCGEEQPETWRHHLDSHRGACLRNLSWPGCGKVLRVFWVRKLQWAVVAKENGVCALAGWAGVLDMFAHKCFWFLASSSLNSLFPR